MSNQDAKAKPDVGDEAPITPQNNPNHPAFMRTDNSTGETVSDPAPGAIESGAQGESKKAADKPATASAVSHPAAGAHKA